MTRTLTSTLFALALLAVIAAPAEGRHRKKLLEENPVAAPAPAPPRKAVFPHPGHAPHGHRIRPGEGAAIKPQRPVHEDHGQARAVAVPRHLHDLGVRNMPPRLQQRQRLDADDNHSSIAWPKEGPRRRLLRADGFVTREHMNETFVHEHFRALVQDPVLLTDVRRFSVEERMGGRYYWHRWRGHDFCHYYDPWGYHWYGWYLGPRFFWVRYYSGGWWWHDPLRRRWCFWYDGFWWWEDPLNLSLVYVYNGSDYVPSDITPTAEPGSPPPTVPIPPLDSPLPTPVPTLPGDIPSLPSPVPSE